MKGFKWGEGRSPAVDFKIDRGLSAATVVYELCARYGICTLCRRKWAIEGRRMCGKCVMINRNAQQKRRDGKMGAS